MGFSRRETDTKGYFCGKCIRLLFWNNFLTCLFLGWWGTISGLTNPFRILFDMGQYARAEVRLGGVIRKSVYVFTIVFLIFGTVMIYRYFNNPFIQSPAATKTYDEVVSSIYPLIGDISDQFFSNQTDKPSVIYFRNKLKESGIDGGIVKIDSELKAEGNLDYCIVVNTQDRGFVYLTIVPKSLEMEDEEQRLQFVYLMDDKKIGLLPAKFAISNDYSWYETYLDNVYTYYDEGAYLTKISDLLQTLKYGINNTRTIMEWSASQSVLDEYNNLIDDYNSYIDVYNEQITAYQNKLSEYPESLFFINEYSINLKSVALPSSIPLPNVSNPNPSIEELNTQMSNIKNLNKSDYKVERDTDKNFMVTGFHIKW
jgi:hypothetical protein